MRVLFYGLNFAPELTGIGKYSGEMVCWLANRGHTVRVVTALPYYPEWKVHPVYRRRWHRESIGNVNVLRCPLLIPRKQTAIGRIALLASFAIASAPALLYEAQRFKPEVVITVEPAVVGLPAVLAAARLVGAGAWLHVQDFEVDAALKLGFMHPSMHGLVAGLEGRLMRAFDTVSTISDRMLERLKTKGVAPERCVLWRNWVDTSEIRPLERQSLYRSELGIPEHRIVALYSGNFGRKQGLEDLVEVAGTAPSLKDITFIFSGAGAAYRDLISMSIGENIRFLPLQPPERLNEFLNLADIHLLPQREDSDLVMPSKLAPMMASGRPVVACALPGSEVAKVVEGAGRTVVPGDHGAIICEIASLAADKEERERLGAVGRKRAQQFFEKESIMLAIEAKLQRVAGEGHGSSLG
jgi:colanic acid biosynthesis glycosyl transferase WcaI